MGRILRSNRNSDIPIMMLYGKAKGMLLLNKYLPSIVPFNEFYIVDSIEAWEEIKETLPERFLFRADSRIGEKPIFIPGANGDKAEIPWMIEEIKKQNQNGVLLVFDCKKEPSQRYLLNGGYNVAVEIDKAIYIDLVGKGFDGRELTKGIACHNSYEIPWDEVLFCDDAGKLSAYKIEEVDSNTYKEDIEKRIEFFKGIDIDPELVRKNIPETFQGIKPYILDNILNQIVIPLYMSREALLREGIRRCGVAGNIDGNDLISFEIYRPERVVDRTR